MPSAYIETTIPSYYVAHTSLNLLQASRQASTRLWWDSGCSGFDLFTSLEVLDEAREGDAEMAAARLELLENATRLEISNDVGLLAEKLVNGGLIPAKAASDAIHIAVASVHEMDYLVTWNFKHIANPFVRDRLRRTVHEAGFQLPVLCSPDELLEYNEDS
ncbi:MAG: type II toxin-antitoxin system VapC family toxin [Puniceicoccaceae bacterium]